MARSRNLKPGFFQNDILAEIEPLGRLLFAGLWTVADRAGRLEDRHKRIKAAVLPYDDCDIDKLLDQLVIRGFIHRYQVDGECFIEIINFSKHQNPHCKEPASIMPAPCMNGASTVQAPEEHRSSRADSLNLIPDSLNPLTDSHPPPSEQGGDSFRMRSGWNPSKSFSEISRQAGLILPGTDEFKTALGEFIAYWITQKRSRTQQEWDHALVKSLKHDKLRAKPGSTGKHQLQPDNFEAKDYGSGVTPL